ncbi:MAG: glycosyltransferase family 2 protein [Lachnospiraceae bacterium]|nr:glycosyltransferase family 2 protein [Lachnospiraceae bacterium]
MSREKVSFVIPCYRSEKTISPVVREIDKTMAQTGEDYEIIMVCDGSPDGTWNVIEALCAEDPRRTGIDFAKNFGQHAALMAGIRRAAGDVIVCLDDDGQTPASEAPRLLKALEDGADVAYASYETPHRSAFRSFGTAMNDYMTRIMLGKPRDLSITSYFAMRRFIADEVIRYEHSYPYLVGLILRTTKNIVNVRVDHRERREGASGYTFRKLLGLWMNGFTAFSITPLRAATMLGSVFAVLGFLYGIYTIVKKLVNPAVPMGFSAIMSALVFFGGMIMLMLGMVGEYVGRTYISVNSAPQYVVRQVCAAQDEDRRGQSV